MVEPFRISRRSLIKVGAAAAGGLAIGVWLTRSGGPSGIAARLRRPPDPDAWIRIDHAGTVTLTVDRAEMGQGVVTSLAQILADEMEADWTRLRVEFAPAGVPYHDPPRRPQRTGGSASIRSSWMLLRRVGASIREMLVVAAADAWGVSPDGCQAERGVVTHRATGRTLTYGDLAESAARVSPPRRPRLKSPDAFRYVGRSMARLDTPAKCDGSAVFGIDVRIPGMLVASVVRAPVLGGRLRSFDGSRAAAAPGVRRVIAISTGVAVVADTYWSAVAAGRLLAVDWDTAAGERIDSEALMTGFASADATPEPLRVEGEPERALAGASQRVEAAYDLPFQAHVTMEPMNCTARVQDGTCEVWASTQVPAEAAAVAAVAAGVPLDRVSVHSTLIGGGFGRRLETDYVTEAVEIARAVGGTVKVIWSREDDLRHDFFRPATHHRLRAGLDAAGLPVAWHHTVVGPKPHYLTLGDPADWGYAIPNLRLDHVLRDSGVPIGAWRAVGENQDAFATECFIDELAAAAGKDAVEYRLRLLRSPRERAVLELAADRAGWGVAAPAGQFRGVAVRGAFGTPIAQVAVVSVESDGTLRVRRVVCAVDCGTVINPDTVEAQIVGGVVYGLSAMLYGQITIQAGRVVQSNFHDYPVPRMPDVPPIEVHLIQSGAAPGGIGEVGTAAIAPALANAIYAATGRRVRRLPFAAG